MLSFYLFSHGPENKIDLSSCSLIPKEDKSDIKSVHDFGVYIAPADSGSHLYGFCDEKLKQQWNQYAACFSEDNQLFFYYSEYGGENGILCVDIQAATKTTQWYILPDIQRFLLTHSRQIKTKYNLRSQKTEEKKELEEIEDDIYQKQKLSPTKSKIICQSIPWFNTESFHHLYFSRPELFYWNLVQFISSSTHVIQTR